MVAAVRASLGNVEEMFVWLERGLVDHDSWLWWITTLPVFDPYREDSRTVDLLRRIGMGG